MKLFFIAILTFTLSSSCSMISVNRVSETNLGNPEEIKEIENNDYLDHLIGLGDFFIKSNSDKVIKLDKKSRKFLDDIVNKLVLNNELFFREAIEVDYYLVKDERPYYFSMPDGKIFLSTGLIVKYVRNENLLSCVLSYELVRSYKNLYYKSQIIPLGSISVERLISLLRINSATKTRIHKWAYYIMGRAEYNNDYYLSLIQIQNRNAIDFSLHLGDTSSISREEYQFKSFLIKRSENESFYNSRKSFYAFLEKVKKLHETR